MSDNYFADLAAVDCSKQIEKKGRFSYLSWPFAIGELLKRHPDAHWRVIENAEGWPYWSTPAGCFVKVGVTVNDVERVQIHPVLNQQNQTVTEPNAFQINTSIQRGLVKAIALHGLGLSIYAGEDVPQIGDDEAAPPADPRLPLFADIRRVGHDRGMNDTDLAGDYATWSQGERINSATVEQLTKYRDQLRKAAA